MENTTCLSYRCKTEVWGMDPKAYFESVKKGPRKNGRDYLLRHLEGKPLTQQQAIRAHCYDCMGFYDGGGRDCGVTTCPLHPFMPFNPSRRRVGWQGKRSADVEDAGE